jgi:hypothetical protein
MLIADSAGLVFFRHAFNPLFGFDSEHARGANRGFTRVRPAVLLDGPEGQ